MDQMGTLLWVRRRKRDAVLALVSLSGEGKLMIKYCILVLVFIKFVVSIDSPDPNGPRIVKSYYLPFRFDTIAGITKSRIKDCYHITSSFNEPNWSQSPKGVIDVLDKAKGQGKFEEGTVRLYIRDANGREYYVDQMGGVSDSKRGIHKLTEDEFTRLKKCIYLMLPPNDESFID